jgi:hypothetical protein
MQTNTNKYGKIYAEKYAKKKKNANHVQMTGVREGSPGIRGTMRG